MESRLLSGCAVSRITWNKSNAGAVSGGMCDICPVAQHGSILRGSFHAIDHEYFNRTACRFQPQSELLLERGKEGRSFGRRIRERIGGEFDVCFEKT